MVPPTLLTSTSMRPKRSVASAISLRAPSNAPRSTMADAASTPCCLSSPTVCSAAGSTRSATTIFPPSCPRRFAAARPMPCPAPVTMQTLSFSLLAPAALGSSSSDISNLPESGIAFLRDSLDRGSGGERGNLPGHRGGKQRRVLGEGDEAEATVRLLAGRLAVAALDPRHDAVFLARGEYALNRRHVFRLFLVEIGLQSEPEREI